MNRLRGRLTYANVIATVALFVALGGSSYAAIKLPKDSVGAKQIKTGAVGAAEVKEGSLGTNDFKSSQLRALEGPRGAGRCRCAWGERVPADQPGSGHVIDGLQDAYRHVSGR